MVSEVVDMCSTSQPDPADPTAAESFKEEGNECFKVGKYQEGLEKNGWLELISAGAVSLYTKAIDLNAAEATYYGNRSFAHLKTEMYGLALADATKSIQLDGTYMKGYYRRAAAHMALGKFKVALKDFKTVLTARPNDPDAKAKFRECEKITKQKAFEKAIAVESCTKSVGETIDLDAMTIDDDYSGPQLENGKVTEEFMTELISTFKKQERLHKRFAYKILLDVEALLKSQPSLVDINIAEAQKFTICGDVHGQFYDLLNIFELNGLPSAQNPYLFNGDFVDRGSFSVECIFTLFGFKVLYPEHFFLARGNHESKIMNSMYGFEGEVRSKYSAEMAELFTEIFNWLPLAHLINSTVLVMHGGLFADDGVKLDDIRLVDRNKQPPDSGIMCDLLWSDPQPQNGRSPSKRGVGIQFGPDVTKRFCLENGLQYIVRSHEVKQEGYEVSHDERCVTVFSAPNYCDMMGNKGAFINIRGDNFKPVFTSYEAVNHPSVRPMAYANSLFGF